MSIVPLSSLRVGTEATVAEVLAPAQAQDHELVLRLIEIGFLPGERLRVIARGQPGDEPIAVRLGHTTFALRRFEAAFIQVQPGRGTQAADASHVVSNVVPLPAQRSATSPSQQAWQPVEPTHDEATVAAGQRKVTR